MFLGQQLYEEEDTLDKCEAVARTAGQFLCRTSRRRCWPPGVGCHGGLQAGHGRPHSRQGRGVQRVAQRGAAGHPAEAAHCPLCRYSIAVGHSGVAAAICSCARLCAVGGSASSGWRRHGVAQALLQLLRGGRQARQRLRVAGVGFEGRPGADDSQGALVQRVGPGRSVTSSSSTCE